MNSSTPAAWYAAMVSASCVGVPPIIGGKLCSARAGASRLISTNACALRSIDDGSRPTRAQKSSSTADLCAMVSGRPQVFQMSAYRATMPSIRCSPEPPMRIGSGRCTGAGSQSASVSW